MKKLTLIGDSIRMGYEKCVRDALAGRAEVWGPEQNGGTSANVLAHLEEWVLARPPDVLHLNCGLHDLKKDFDTQEPQVALDAYEANLRAIFTRVKEESAATLIWVETTPVNEKLHHRNKGFDRFEGDVDAYNKVGAAVAAEFELPVNDLFGVVEAGGRDALLSRDGVHFTEEGSALLGRAVANFVRPYLLLEEE